MTFCCSKQLSHTLLLSRITQPSTTAAAATFGFHVTGQFCVHWGFCCGIVLPGRCCASRIIERRTETER